MLLFLKQTTSVNENAEVQLCVNVYENITEIVLWKCNELRKIRNFMRIAGILF